VKALGPGKQIMHKKKRGKESGAEGKTTGRKKELRAGKEPGEKKKLSEGKRKKNQWGTNTLQKKCQDSKGREKGHVFGGVRRPWEKRRNNNSGRLKVVKDGESMLRASVKGEGNRSKNLTLKKKKKFSHGKKLQEGKSWLGAKKKGEIKEKRTETYQPSPASLVKRVCGERGRPIRRGENRRL